jgi:hypothetical protein
MDKEKRVTVVEGRRVEKSAFVFVVEPSFQFNVDSSVQVLIWAKLR